MLGHGAGSTGLRTRLSTCSLKARRRRLRAERVGRRGSRGGPRSPERVAGRVWVGAGHRGCSRVAVGRARPWASVVDVALHVAVRAHTCVRVRPEPPSPRLTPHCPHVAGGLCRTQPDPVLVLYLLCPDVPAPAVCGRGTRMASMRVENVLLTSTDPGFGPAPQVLTGPRPPGGGCQSPSQTPTPKGTAAASTQGALLLFCTQKAL